MFMVHAGKLAAVLLLNIIAVYGFNISLSGTVKDDFGKPVAGATVTTTYYNYSDLSELVITKTDTLGHFNLKVDNLSIRHQERFYLNAVTKFCIKNNVLEFTSSSHVISGKLDIVTTDGKIAHSVPLKRSSRGKQMVVLPSDNSFGVYILRLNVNGTIYTGNLLCLGMWKYALTGLEYKQIGGVSLSNANTIIDTLVVMKKNMLVSRVPLNSYTKTDIAVTETEGILRKIFLISDTMVTGWKMGKSTVDSSFTLWNSADIYSNIDGGGAKYVVNGMKQMADLYMKGSTNSDGTTQSLVPQSSFIMDFGTAVTAKNMYQYMKDQFYDSDALKLPGYSDSLAYVTKSISGITLFSYCKQFYFELCMDNFPSHESAMTAGKMFLEFFISKVK
jgi:hypothetical protein